MKMHETKNGKVFDEKSSLQTLIADLQKIARENKKKTAAVMYKRLEQGFEGEANEEATNEIWSSISEIDDLADLSLRVGIKITASRNKNRLFKNLYVKMQGRASEKVGFPRDIPLYINFFDRERHNRLLDWIKQNKEDNKITINWVKNSLVCLVNPEMIEEDMLIINCIIRVFCASLGKSKKEKASKKKKASPGYMYSNFLRQIGNCLTAKSFSPSRFAAGLDMTQILEERNRKLEQENFENNKKILQKQEEIKNLEKIGKNLREYLNNKNIENENLKKALLKAEKELIEEKAYHVRMKRQWEQETAMKIRGDTVRMKEYLDYEIKVMREALMNQKPDIQIVRDTLEVIQKFLDNMDKKHE